MQENPPDEIAKKQQFASALWDLGARGRIAELTYQTTKQEYGSAVAEDAGRVPKSRPTSEALTQLLSTIPGIEITPANRETMTRPGSMIASEYCVSTFKQKDGNNYTGVSVSIPQSPDSGTHVVLEHVYATDGRKKGDRVTVGLYYTKEGDLESGEMEIGTIEEDQFVRGNGGLRFDPQGRITKPWGSMERHLGEAERIDIAKAARVVSSDERLNNPIDIKQILTEITPPAFVPPTTTAA